MSFRFKIALAVLGGVCACQPTPATGPQEDSLALRSRLSQIIVTPSSASVPVGATQQFTAYGRTRGGDSVAVTASWSSSNPAAATVTSSGLVAGVSAGSAAITGAASGLRGSATVTVPSSAPQVPGSVTNLSVVSVADTAVTLSFTEVNDGSGKPASYDVRFAAGAMSWGSGSEVASGSCATPVTGIAVGAPRTCTVLGLTASTAYQFQLVAFRGTLGVNAVFGGLSNVVGATTAASNGGSGGGTGDPSPGPTSTIIVQDGFEGADLSAWTVDATGRYSLSTTASRVHSGRQSLQVLFSPTNGYGDVTRWFMPGYDEVYVKFYVQFQEGFENLRSDGNGMHFLTMCGNNISNQWACSGKAGIVPSGSDYFYAGLDPEEVGLPTLQPLSFYTYWPDMACCYGTYGFQSIPKTPLVGGQWQEVVMHIKMNTPGQYDGLQEVWVNGVKKLSQTNMRWRTTTDLRINQIRFDNYMPGGPQTQYLWIDDLTVWKP